MLLPLVLVAVIATLELASSGPAVEPDAAPVVALAILAAGAAFGAVGTVLDRRARRSVRRAEHDRLVLLTGRGYAPDEGSLAAALPRRPDETAPPTIGIWRRDGHAFLDAASAGRLRDDVDERWQALAAGDARGPRAGVVLLEVEPLGGPRRAEMPTELRLATLRPGADPPRHTATLGVNNDGLFDVTDLVD